MAKKATKNTEICGCCSKPSTCCFANIVIGIGLGALLFNLIFSLHPVKWGLGLIIVGVVCYLLPKMIKK